MMWCAIVPIIAMIFIAVFVAMSDHAKRKGEKIESVKPDEIHEDGVDVEYKNNQPSYHININNLSHWVDWRLSVYIPQKLNIEEFHKAEERAIGRMRTDARARGVMCATFGIPVVVFLILPSEAGISIIQRIFGILIFIAILTLILALMNWCRSIRLQSMCYELLTSKSPKKRTEAAFAIAAEPSYPEFIVQTLEESMKNPMEEPDVHLWVEIALKKIVPHNKG